MYQSATTAVPIDPIISRLRPRTVAEVLDQAFRLYRKRFLTFVAIIAVVHVPLQLLIQGATVFLLGDLSNIEGDLTSSDISSGSMNEVFSFIFVLYGAIFGLSILYGLLQKLSEGALIAGVADSYLDRPVGFGSSYRQMFKSAGPLIGLIFLQLLIYIALFLPIVLMFLFAFGLALGNDTSAAAGGGLICLSCFLFLPAVAALIYISIRLTVTTPALIVERLGPVQCIRRSWGLVQNYWWRTLALQGLLLVFSWVVQLGPSSIISGLVSVFAPRDLVLQQLLSGFVTVFTTLIYVPLQLIAITLYYFDLRVRKEGYDLETAMAQRYAPNAPMPAWGGAYGGHGQPQYGQTQPISGYTPPQLGGDTQAQQYGATYPLPPAQEFGSEYGWPTSPPEPSEWPEPPETPGSPQQPGSEQ